jgi:hypothetical protein
MIILLHALRSRRKRSRRCRRIAAEKAVSLLKSRQSVVLSQSSCGLLLLIVVKQLHLIIHLNTLFDLVNSSSILAVITHNHLCLVHSSQGILARESILQIFNLLLLTHRRPLLIRVLHHSELRLSFFIWKLPTLRRRTTEIQIMAFLHRFGVQIPSIVQEQHVHKLLLMIIQSLYFDRSTCWMNQIMMI